MLKFIKWFFGLFSPYVHPFEKKVDKFFKGIKSTDNFVSVKKKLLELMKENLIIVNVWMERKYKGYEYLNKKTRKQMYQDIEQINKKFLEFYNAEPSNAEEIKKIMDSKNLSYPTFAEEEIGFIYGIMRFLKPGKYYHYIKTASFGKLLRDPNKQKLEGDCNQIVTLYIHLYSLKYSIDDLEIKLLPEHVCLHFKNIDIEATNGKFEKYRDYNELLPVTEIISTNLLDLTDFREDVQSIDEKTMLKSAQLANAISSLKSLVSKNLEIAYKNLAISFIKNKNFDSAIFYLLKAGDRKSLHGAYHNAAIYYMDQRNYRKALYYADKSNNSELEKTVKHNQGVYYFKKDNLDRALKVFTDLGDEKMKKACYMKKYNKLAKQVSGVKTLKEAKKKKDVYKKMLVLAQKIGDNRLIEGVRSTLGKI